MTLFECNIEMSVSESGMLQCLGMRMEICVDDVEARALILNALWQMLQSLSWKRTARWDQREEGEH